MADQEGISTRSCDESELDGSGSSVCGRDTLEFSRVANLPDAVFAIAMTLLVLTIDIPDVPSTRLGSALRGQAEQYLAFIIAFGVVANVWWRHHQIVNLLRFFEPLLIALNVLLLAVVVLVPFPAALIGNAHFAQAAVLPFIGLFIVVNILCVALIVRANNVDAWRWMLPLGTFYWLIFSYLGGVAVLVFAFILALWFPFASMMVVLVGTIVGPVTSAIWYRRYGEIDA